MTKLTEQIIRNYGSIDNYVTSNEYEKKSRKDKGSKRERYDSSLPKKYKSYLSRANRKGIKMDLSIEEFNDIISKECHYCGSSNSQGVDRIDSSKGYEIGNVQPCCSKCNIMKFTYSNQDFLDHVARIHNHINKEN